MDDLENPEDERILQTGERNAKERAEDTMKNVNEWAII